MSQEPKVTVALTLQQANIVLEGLTQLPFRLVNELITEIQNQVQPQLNQQAPPTATPVIED